MVDEWAETPARTHPLPPPPPPLQAPPLPPPPRAEQPANPPHRPAASAPLGLSRRATRSQSRPPPSPARSRSPPARDSGGAHGSSSSDPLPPGGAPSTADSGPSSQPPPPSLCLACDQPPQLCPDSCQGTCSVCQRPFSTTNTPVDYEDGTPDAGDVAPEVWVPPASMAGTSWPPIRDGYSYPLTWARVRDAHAWLLAHASCATAGPDAFGTDDDGTHRNPCHCTWHPMSIELREDQVHDVYAWPGPICGSCWAASCECGYVFTHVAYAAGRWPSGRLKCCACVERDAAPEE